MRHALALAALFLAATPAFAESPFDDAKRVDDRDLAQMRGGFAIPGGIGVALAVQMDVAVDGALVLRTVFRADQGPSTLTVYAPAPGQTGPSWSAPAPTPGTRLAPVAPVVIIDRAAGITTLQPGLTTPTSVAVSSVGDANVGAAPVGLMPLNVTVGGPAVETGGGALQLVPISQGTRITLADNGTIVTQLVGQAFLNAVTNSASNRMIDTSTSLNVNLTGASATQFATAALRAQDIAVDAATRFVR